MLLSKKYLTISMDFFLIYWQLFINNEYVDSVSKKTFATTDPVTEGKICEVAEGEKVLEHIDSWYSFNFFFVFLIKDAFVKHFYVFYLWLYIYFLTPKTWFYILPPSADTHFLVNKFQEFGVKLR